ncbi:polyphosphate polymerase domain-containing protein [Bacteriovoracales bacterium]|nr:polyphosphate polymerase domain-containing protein [Bacteriovoracales bacterium]
MAVKKENFARYEFKFLLRAEKRIRVENEVKNFMRFDGYCHESLDNSYYVNSLYFDDPKGASFYEKVDGIKTRKKYRIRSYGETYEEGIPIFFEEKVRYNNRTLKYRIPILEEHIPLFCDERKILQVGKYYPGIDFVDRFIYQKLKNRIRPRVKVLYIRRPYVSDYDMNFRITFDDSIKGLKTDSIFSHKKDFWKLSAPGYTILEVKFFRRIPAWFHRILQKNNLERVSISKFCLGMEATGQELDLS